MLLVGGLIAFGAYKLSSKDADRIEEHTGKSADDLSDEEIAQAMDDLGIEGEELSEQDEAYLDQQEAKEAAPAASGGAAPASSGEPDYLDELEKLSKLRDEGVITDEEFEAKKKQLLGL